MTALAFLLTQLKRTLTKDYFLHLEQCNDKAKSSSRSKASTFATSGDKDFFLLVTPWTMALSEFEFICLEISAFDSGKWGFKDGIRGKYRQ